MVSEDRNDDRRLEVLKTAPPSSPSAAQPPIQPSACHWCSSSRQPPAAFPAPAFNADFKFDYTADPMDVNASQQGLYAANSLVR
jgi:hypothetical protein